MAEELTFTFWGTLRGLGGPCPACGGAQVHELGCEYMATKRRAFAAVLLPPAIVVLVFLNDGAETTADWIGTLVACAAASALVGIWHRRRLARQRRR